MQRPGRFQSQTLFSWYYTSPMSRPIPGGCRMSGFPGDVIITNGKLAEGENDLDVENDLRKEM